jgi:outer membrane protein OmpA-like peptidoglycan-associated protein
MTDQRDHMVGNMQHNTDEFTRRRASLAVIGGVLLLPLVGSVRAVGQPTEQEMLEALRKRSSRAPAATDPGRINEERDFIEELRHRPIRSITEEDRTKVAKIAQDKPSIDLEINFDFNSAVLSPKAIPLAVGLGRALVNPQLSGVVFLVGGHTDAKGGDTYNLDLSRRRAETIKAFLVESFGVPATNLIAVGFGKEHLKNPSNPFADENRRVQVVNMLETE